MGKAYLLPSKTYTPKHHVKEQRVGGDEPARHTSRDVSRSSQERVVIRNGASESVHKKSRTGGDRPASQSHKRHVTFELPHPPRDPSSIHPALRGPASGRRGAITAVDHAIARHGGSTSTLDCLPNRLKITKAEPPTTPQKRIEELQRENGHLRRELTYYKDTREVLVRMLEATKASHQTLQDILSEAARGVAISEQRYVGYWVLERDEGYEENVF